ncbi:MAG: M16 family metallopeptidase [Candidatus Polarisedimenticolia bacterium]
MANTGVSAATGGFKLPPATGRTLPNGVRVNLMEYHELPLVDFQVVVGAGAAHDPKGKEGLASLTAELLRKGTTKRNAKEIADAVDFVGGALGGSADHDGTRVTAEFMAKDVDLALELLADTVMSPVFAPDEVEREKGDTLAELQAAKENPSLLASRRFVELLFANHPYGHPTVGWESTVKGMTAQDVKAFHARHFVPGNIIIVGVGDFSAAEMMAKLEKHFGGWKGPRTEETPIPKPAPPAAKTIYLIDKPDSTQSQVRMGSVGIRRTDPDYVIIQVANAILGGGFTSRLVEEIRVNRSLSYGASSRFYPLVQNGPFVVSTFTKNETTGEIIKVAREVLAKFHAEGATAEEVDKARKYLRGGFAISHQAPDALADALAEIAFYGLPTDYYDTYLDKIDRVTLDDVRRVARERFPIDTLITVVLGEGKAVRAQLEPLGPVTAAPLAGH